MNENDQIAYTEELSNTRVLLPRWGAKPTNVAERVITTCINGVYKEGVLEFDIPLRSCHITPYHYTNYSYVKHIFVIFYQHINTTGVYFYVIKSFKSATSSISSADC